MVVKLLTAIVLAAIILPSVSFGDNINGGALVPDSSAVSSKISTSGLEIIIRLLISVVVITVLIYASVWGLKRLSSYKPGARRSGGSIEIIENSFLGPKKGLHVIKAGGKYILIGSTENSMSLICELSPDDFKTPPVGLPGSKKKNGFREMLERFKTGSDKPFLSRAGKIESAQ